MTAVARDDWAVYDRPDLLETISLPLPGGAREVLLGVDGVHCAACVARVERLLAGRASDVRVSLPTRTLEFAFRPSEQPLSSLLAALDAAAFAPQVLAQDSRAKPVTERRAALARIGVAALGAMQVMMLAWPTYFDGAELDTGVAQLLRWTQWLFATPVVFYGGWPFLRNAWRALATRSLDMDVPVAVSLLIAYGASAWRVAAGAGEIYFDAATMFVLLLAAGRYLEGRTRAEAAGRLRLLAGRRAVTASRRSAAGVETVPITVLRQGDVVEIAPGEAVPVDGRLLDAAASLDESLLTGEARPVAHAAGDRILGGSINIGSRPFAARAESVGAATRLAEITRILQQAARERPRFQQLADRLAGHFILGVLALAGLGAALWWDTSPDHALSVALAVLVASCPCALSLAMPVVFAAASARLAGAGVLVARPAALERVAGVDVALFDKTGTLTEGGLAVARIHTLAGVPAAECAALAAALERALPHPVARAFSEYASAATASDVLVETAAGVSGRVGGVQYRLGAADAAVLPEAAQAHLASANGAAFTWVVLARGGELLALFGLDAQPRVESAAVLAQLRDDGVAVELLTGDGIAAAETLARGVGLARVRARQTPEQKLARLQELQAQGRVVLAVGDGVNDAPFLAAADVSVAMPQGAALAQARADAILVNGSLRGLIEMRRVGAAAQRRIRENVAWALGYNLVVLPLALAGVLTPWMAALGMSVSSLLVVFNALRLGPVSRSARGTTVGFASLNPPYDYDAAGH